MGILEESQLRIQRTSEHLADLKTALEEFDPDYDLITGDNYWVAVRKAFFHAFKPRLVPPTPPKITVLIGEIIYHFRAALDHAVFQLAKFDSGGVEQGGTQFPICDLEKDFRRKRKSLLVGVSDEHVALIERLQPYKGCDWTKQLRSISNPDKHRHLTRVGVDVGGGFLLDVPLTGSFDPDKPVNMYAGQNYAVTFADETLVIETLEILKSQISDLLVQFEALMSPP